MTPSNQSPLDFNNQQWRQRNPAPQNLTQREMNVICNTLAANLDITSLHCSLSREANNSYPILYNAAPNYINLVHRNPSTNLPPNGARPHISNGIPFACITSPQNLPSMQISFPPQRPFTNKLIDSARNVTNHDIKKQKRIRTAYTTEQLNVLETEYSRTRYLDRTRRLELCAILNLKEKSVKNWFQNRRMREKIQKAQLVEDLNNDEQLSPEVQMIQHHCLEHNNGMSFFAEEYSVPSISVPLMTMVETSTSVGSTAGHAIAEASRHCFQQVDLQMQQYPAQCNQNWKSPKLTSQSESSVSIGTAISSNYTDGNLDMSFLHQ